MAEIRKTVGVYERPQKRGAMRTAIIVAVVAVAAAATGLAVFVF